jgi:steroid 5-alpha reductase family enzyme
MTQLQVHALRSLLILLPTVWLVRLAWVHPERMRSMVGVTDEALARIDRASRGFYSAVFTWFFPATALMVFLVNLAELIEDITRPSGQATIAPWWEVVPVLFGLASFLLFGVVASLRAVRRWRSQRAN